jgi:hypothetical protein
MMRYALLAAILGSTTGSLLAQHTRGLPPPILLCGLSLYSAPPQGFGWNEKHTLDAQGYFDYRATKYGIRMRCTAGTTPDCRYVVVWDHYPASPIGASFAGFPKATETIYLDCNMIEPAGMPHTLMDTTTALGRGHYHQVTIYLFEVHNGVPSLVQTDSLLTRAPL